MVFYAALAATSTALRTPVSSGTKIAAFAVAASSRRLYSSTRLQDQESKNRLVDNAVFPLASRLDGLDKPTVWHEFTPLALKHNAVNLGQGFPDWDPPSFVVEAMRQATDPSVGRHANQYARSYAHLPLANVLAEEYSKRFGRTINPETQIATAVGCTNALYCSLQGLVNPGDEVVMLEPAFDIYMSSVQMAGGVAVYCPLRPSTDESTMRSASLHFTLNLDELESKLTPRTKVLLLNSPHNPTGKMFSRQELEGISKLLQNYPAITVLSDEVYEHIVRTVCESCYLSPQILTKSDSASQKC
jgi:kynurenine---oxoglutarate transaminase / cysteine-S-conjugate beta-lyase / glutamine---phenylpyruvate transaminase